MSANEVLVPEEKGMDIERLMDLAISRGGDVMEVITTLAELRNSEMDRQAARDFQTAFAEFHRRCPAIPRDTKGKKLATQDGSGTVTLMFAGLETIQRIVDPILGDLGFSYSFTVPKASDKSLIVECMLWHESGHMRQSQMPVPISQIPKASQSQEFAGARTTGKRLTLSDVLGLATEDMDPGGDSPVISDEQRSALSELVAKKTVDIDEVLQMVEAESLSDVSTAQFPMLKRFLETRPDK